MVLRLLVVIYKLEFFFLGKKFELIITRYNSKLGVSYIHFVAKNDIYNFYVE